jgi:hypothetical protein
MAAAMHHPRRKQHQGADMNAAHRSLAALFIAAALTACGAGRQEAEESPASDTASSNMVGTMDEARAVADTALQRKEETDRAMEAAESNH